MARPTVIRDETIVDAARDVFLARGIRATTAEVAERAGVSEGSIFKRFKSKVELFQAAMRSHVEEPSFVRTFREQAGKGDLKENLYRVGLEVAEFFRTLMPLMMMAWSNPGEDGLPCIFRDTDPPPPFRILRAATDFFRAEVELGRLARHDPEVLARTFLGSIQNYVVFEIFHRGRQGEASSNVDSFVRDLVQLLWTGCAPAEPTP